MKKSIIFCAVLTVCAIAGMLAYQFTRETVPELTSESKPLIVWYTDEALVDYMNDAAVKYEEKYGTKVNPHLVSALEYMEKIQEETLHGEEGPDVFLVGNDSLEKAALSGLGMEVKDEKRCLNSTYFPNVALNAATYDGKFMGYPFSYNTAVFLYNDTYMKEIAKLGIEAERNRIAGEAANAEAEAGNVEENASGDPDAFENIPPTDEEIAIRVEEILPTSLVGILEFANNYDAPMESEEFFKWDVCDVLYNYMFAGAYMDLGGECGDDPDEIDLYNENAIYNLCIFQDFNQFFSIESDEVDYDDVMQDFKDGKLVFTLANAGIISELEKAKADGSFQYEYGIQPIGMVNASLKAKGLSVTQVAVVNGYGKHREEAENLAYFLCCEYSENLYIRSGEMSAYRQKSYAYPQMEQVLATYEISRPIPKIVESSNYWLLAERLYTECWDGADVNDKLQALSLQIRTQIRGEAEEDEYIPTPEIKESYVEEEEE